MKKELVTLLLGMGLICTFPEVNAVEYREHLNKEFTLTKDASVSTLFIYNISGFIRVEGYSGTKVLLEMDKTISADDEKLLEEGKKEFTLAFDNRSDSIIAYISSPLDSRPRKNRYQNNEIEYEFNVDFTVKVPYGMNLNISTINNGNVAVNNVSGQLNVNNVNEGIEIKNAKSKTNAHTVNGDVSVSYLVNPPDESSYYTINGDINVRYQPDLSADLQFKSMNGEMFTDFPSVQLLPAAVNKAGEKKGSGIIYKLTSTTSVRFGKGGKIFRFETINGNVYIRKQS